ncbi:MAG: MFS transporter [Proteobacteria bacterium]|nr:MFS transporter [Pseudomonadota bacterium]
MSEPSSPAKRDSVVSAFAFLGDRRALVMLGLGFAAGLPFLLVFDTLSAWLRQANVSLETIGYFSLATIASSLKFLWAPLIDRTNVPVLTKLLGHRRSWMLVAQAAIVLGLWLIAGANPAQNLNLVAIFAVCVGFASATQDIVVDAWRIEAAEQERQGMMAAAYQWGYRVAQIIAGALALALADAYGWALSYTVMAALMAIGIGSVLFAPREQAHTIRHIPVEGIPHRPIPEAIEWLLRLLILIVSAILIGLGLTGNGPFLGFLTAPLIGAQASTAFTAAFTAKPDGIWLQLLFVVLGFVSLVLATLPTPGVRTRPGASLWHLLWDPLRDFFARHRNSAGLILALICVYRLAESVLTIMNPFYQDLGFSLTEIAEVRKLFGVVASLIGVSFAGVAILRLGLMRSLVIGAFAQPISHIGFMWLATQGHHMPALFTAIGLDNVASGFAGTCLIAYMSSLTSVGFTASQYALFSSLYSLFGKIIASQSGRIVESSAQAAEGGGAFGALRSLFSGLTPETYSRAANLHVAASSLGAGYVVFFLYTAIVGIAGVILAMIIAARPQTPASETTPKPA